MKFNKYLMAFLLLIISAGALLAQNQSITMALLNGSGEHGYYSTYNDFLKGNIVSGEYEGTGNKLMFKINGKTEAIDPADIWGYRDNKGKLVRINKRDMHGYGVYAVGDIIFYAGISLTPAEENWGRKTGYCLMLFEDFNSVIHYNKDGSAVYSSFGGSDRSIISQQVSANLNSDMISHKDFEDDATFKKLANGDTGLLNFNSRYVRNPGKRGMQDMKEATFTDGLIFKSHLRYVAFSRNRGKECYFGEYY
jgi:hypothetical protein